MSDTQWTVRSQKPKADVATTSPRESDGDHVARASRHDCEAVVPRETRATSSGIRK
jgi:hypothetical protein